MNNKPKLKLSDVGAIHHAQELLKLANGHVDFLQTFKWDGVSLTMYALESIAFRAKDFYGPIVKRWLETEALFIESNIQPFERKK